MSLRPRAVSAPPRGRRSRLEEVLAAGLARLSLQPADVGMRPPEKSKGKGKKGPPQYEDASGMLWLSLDELEKEAHRGDGRSAFLRDEAEEREVLDSVGPPQLSRKGAGTRFFQEQIDTLTAWVLANPRKTPDPTDLDELKAATRLEVHQIKNWIIKKRKGVLDAAAEPEEDEAPLDGGTVSPEERVMQAWWDKHAFGVHERTFPTGLEKTIMIRDAKAAGGELTRQAIDRWFQKKRKQTKQAMEAHDNEFADSVLA